MVTTTTGLATSFIQFSRPGATGGGATVTDSDGRIKWAGHNLLTNSESFDASAWAKSNLSVSANAFAAPNGTTTADKLIASSASGVHRTSQFGLPDVSKTAVIFARAAEYNFISIGQTTGAYAVVNLTTGAVTQSSGTIPAPVSVGSGWWRIEIPNTTTDYVLSVVDTGTFTADQYGSKSFTGDNTSGVYVWGAHLYRSDLGSMVLNPARGDAYYPTTVRNMLGFTDDFSNAAWLTVEAAPASGSEIAPNGLPTGDRLSDNAISSRHIIYQQFSGDFAVPRTLSVYAKANTLRYLALSVTNTGDTQCYSAIFDLQTGGAPVTKTNGLATVTAQITPAGNGWYRCAISGIISTSSSGNFFPLIGTSNRADFSGSLAQNNMPLYVGTGGSLYLWGAQLSDSASLDAYSPVYGAAVTSAAYYAPRLDYDANGSALGLLVEEQRTNIATHSSEFDNSTFWPRADVDVTANATAAPDGTTTADKLIASATTANHLLNRTNFITVTNGLSYTHSIYAKASEYAFIRVQFQASGFLETWANFNLTTGAVGLTNGSVTTSIRAVGNGWYRCSVSATATANGNSGMQLFVLDSDRGGSSPSYLGNGTSGIFIWGAQVETSASFPTSFIPTIGNTTATRTADVASVSTQAFPYSATEGTLVASGSRFSTTGANCVIAELGDGGATNIFELYRVSGSTSGALYVASGGVGSTITVSNAFPLDTVSKIGGVYKANDFQAAANGTLGTPVTSGAVPTAASNLYIGKYGGLLTNQWNGHIRQITYLPRRISNAELQSRTA